MTGPREVAVVPNCLRGFATAAEVAAALAVGVRRALPDAPVVVLPLADGGDGTLAVLAASGIGRWMSAPALDALGRSRPVPWLAVTRHSAILESAAVCGLGALRPRELNPLEASSAGVGQLLVALVSAGFTEVMLGLGGTAIVDGGAGALAALGARFLDAKDRILTPRPSTLGQVVRVDLAPARRLLAGVSVRLWSDVRTPPAGNLGSFGAQKGITASTRPVASAALHHLVELLAAAGAPELRKRFHQPWFGAGGGIGLGLSSVVTTTAGSGADGLLELVDTEGMVSSVALAITAEGRVDDTTWHGKLPDAIATRRRKQGLPTAVVATRFTGRHPQTLVSRHLVVDPPPARPITGEALWDGLARASEHACLTWSAVRS